MRNKYQRKERKSNRKFEVVGGEELMVRVPLPMAEVWAEMQAQVEELTGKAGLQILRAILENEVTRRVGPPHRPNPSAGCVRWGKQRGYVVFGGQKIPLERPRVRTREGAEVELESYGQLQQDGKLQRAVQERMVAGLSTPNYRRAVESVVESYGIEKSSVRRQFVEASSNQLRTLCERRLEDLNLVVLMKVWSQRQQRSRGNAILMLAWPEKTGQRIRSMIVCNSFADAGRRLIAEISFMLVVVSTK